MVESLENVGDKKPEDYFEWTKRDVQIKDIYGRVIYDGKGIEVPKDWSDLCAKVVGSKYFFVGDEPKKPIETSVKQLVHRVADSITKNAVRQKILSEQDYKKFYGELCHLVYSQSMAFNSPVWFNVGLHDRYGIKESKDVPFSSHWGVDDSGIPKNDIDSYERPQGSACFIQSIDDNMESILLHARKEGMLFKYGSGTGTNYSTLRGINEPLSGGGLASGSISFLRIYDVLAGRIQSGGKTRRAAKMVILNDKHPDFLRFVLWKVNEEKKALFLSANPVWGPRTPSDLESEAYKTVDGQNGNNSVRLSDEFMEAALENEHWDLEYITANRIKDEREILLSEYRDDRFIPDKRFIEKLTNKRKIINAGDALELIARAAYVIGDPGVQFDSTINKWHTCPNSDRINASNPCSEFMFIDNSACNLASFNLTKFLHERGLLDTDKFEKAVENTITAQEVLVDYCSYPSEEIARNSHNFRPLGLGYTNLGVFLMSKGIAYDSDEGRAIASGITSLLTAKAYEASADLASRLGPFNEFEKNKELMLEVIKRHAEHSRQIKKFDVSGLEEIIDEANKVWESAIEKGQKYGFRNAQVTLLAPTGTISFMMDADCTGIEPMTGLKSTKGLAGGGELHRDVSSSVVFGLKSLGYGGESLEKILDYINEHGSVVDAPELDKKHYKVFETSMGDNPVSIDGHLMMMTAVQPFLSGAISKTVNLPKGSSIEDIKNTYVKAWKLGLKSVTPFVDGSKGIQPVTVLQKKLSEQLKRGERKKPLNPIERVGWNVDIGNTGVHFIVGEYCDEPPKNSLADYFVEFGSSGSPYSAVYTSWAKEASRARQLGESVEKFVEHNLGATGVIRGTTNHPFIRLCSSIEDFFAKLILLEYLGDTSRCDVKPISDDIEKLRCNVLGKRRRMEHYSSRIRFIDKVINEGKVTEIFPLYEDEVEPGKISVGEDFCRVCGSPTILSGANCRKCPNCGDAPGCG